MTTDGFVVEAKILLDQAGRRLSSLSVIKKEDIRIQLLLVLREMAMAAGRIADAIETTS